MKIHCPKCKNVFSEEVPNPDTPILCPACEHSFTLSNKETILVNQPPPQIPAAGSHLGGYLIEQELGRGGMGIVFQGVQESLGRKVAIKVMYPKYASDPQFVARFNREAKSLANLNHPNIVGILDRGCDKGIYYFVMEFVDGLSLRHLINEKSLSSTQALVLVPKICEALEYAHSEGIIHRDIKPENILIDKQGKVKIADFGLSRIIRGEGEETRITRSNLIMGTVDYMAPEQRLDSKSVDHRADIYSLGVVLYELLTGELPIGRFDPPSQKNVEVDIRIDEVVLKVLDKNPDLRYQRATDMGSEISRISTPGAPVPGATLSVEEKTFIQKMEDRWESAVLAAVVVLFLIHPSTNWVLFIVWGILFQHIRKKRQRGLGPAGGPMATPSAMASPSDVQDSQALAHASPPSGAQAQAPLAPAPETSQPPVAQAPDQPSTSVLAVLVLAYSLFILLIFPVGLPFRENLFAEFSNLPMEQMGAILSVSALGVLLGFFGLLLGIVARGRIDASPLLAGRSAATVAVLLNVLFIGGYGLTWYDAYKEYKFWKQLDTRVEQNDPGVEDTLKKLARDQRGEKVFLLAQDLDPDRALAFFHWGMDSGEVPRGPQYAVRGLSRIKDRSKEVSKLFTTVLSDRTRSHDVKVEIAHSARHLPHGDALTVLGHCAVSPDIRLRQGAAESLEEIPNAKASDLLLRLGLDPDRTVALVAVDSLEDRWRSTSRESSSRALGTILLEATELKVRTRALKGLQKYIQSGNSFPLSILEHVSKAAQTDSSEQLREEASRTLEKAREKMKRNATRRDAKSRRPGPDKKDEGGERR